MTPRTPEQIREKLYNRNWRMREMKLVRDNLGDDVLFWSAFGVFTEIQDSEKNFADQEYAGDILLDLLPKCPTSCFEVIESSLEHWNRSIEQLPLYLEKEFGRNHVLDTIDELEKKYGMIEKLKIKIETFRYWLKAKERNGKITQPGSPYNSGQSLRD